MYGPGSSQDAVVIGGGFYGAAIAIYLAKQRGLKRILLIERESTLMQRASYNNQARVHNGYHYPRSFTTAYRSRINFQNFLRDWPGAVCQDFIKLYAIARRNSKVTARQFERFCRDIGADLQPVDPGLRKLFEPRLIEDVFQVQECAFDSTKLAEWAHNELRDARVSTCFDTRARAVTRSQDLTLEVHTENTHGQQTSTHCRYLFNCTYSGLNHLKGEFPGIQTGIKQEITEMALMTMPPILKDIGITVMDGPYFSIMPFPPRGLHSLSHVRYTPHASWNDQPDIAPYERLNDYHRHTRVDHMMRDAGRYIPAVLDAIYEDSLFEIKTVLTKNEVDDGRPIFFEKHAELPGCYSILGGKIDNIYDVLEKLDAEPLL